GRRGGIPTRTAPPGRLARSLLLRRLALALAAARGDHAAPRAVASGPGVGEAVPGIRRRRTARRRVRRDPRRADRRGDAFPRHSVLLPAIGDRRAGCGLRVGAGLRGTAYRRAVP